MDAIVKFKEAAAAFQQDERYLKMEAARKANDEDTELQNMLAEFTEIRMNLNQEMNNADRDEAALADMNARINSLYNDIMGNEHMQAYNEAKQGIEGFMDYVNAILNAAIEGDNPMEVEEPVQGGCGSGGCASCSGCS